MTGASIPAVDRSVVLRAAPDAVWARAITPDGVNDEFWPWLRMSFPAELASLEEGWRPGARLGRSWLLLFGVLPVEYDDVVIVALEPGRRFLERSSMALVRVWEHERIVAPHPAGAKLTDRVRLTPRLPGLHLVLGPIVRAVFAWRHRRLRRRFGAGAA